jgi:YgiT-type zinc finger domain-containing protein
MEPDDRDRARTTAGDALHKGTSSCERCGHDTYEDVVKAALWMGSRLVAIEGVPTRVCEACGEQHFTEQIAQAMREAAAEPDANARCEIRVPVFSLKRVETPTRTRRQRPPDEEDMEPVESVFDGVEDPERQGEEDQEAQHAHLCQYCQSETYEDVVRSAVWGYRGLAAIEDIRARVCRGCGERFYDDETVGKMEEFLTVSFAPEKAHREIIVPVFSLARAATNR